MIENNLQSVNNTNNLMNFGPLMFPPWNSALLPGFYPKLAALPK